MAALPAGTDDILAQRDVTSEEASGVTEMMTVLVGSGDISTLAETTTSESSKMDADMNMADSLICHNSQ